MFLIRKIAIAACLLAITSCSGCCLFSPYGAGGCGGGCAAGPSCGLPAPTCGIAAPSCGLESYGGGCGGCDSCGGGPVIPCTNGTPGGCGLGLGCIGKVLGMLSCSGGCGETYYHDWISDPPCCDPCDGCGNWTGEAGAGGYGSCAGGGCTSGGGCLSGGCTAAPTCGAPVFEPSCGCASAPTCGAAGGCGYERTSFQMPGRALYATWSGVGGLFRELRRGFVPSCQTCNAFSMSGHCNSCASTNPSCSCGVVSSGSCGGGCNSGGGDVYFGGAGAGTGACSTCSHQVVSGNRGHTIAQTSGQLPHHVVTKQIKVAHGRPPHKVVSDRLRLR